MNPCILAATDLSAPSRHAVARAYMLARARGWRLHLAHAIAPGAFDGIQAMMKGGAPSIADTLIADAHRRLEELNADSRWTRGVTAKINVLRGAPVDVIARYADEVVADLLVAGARGEGFLRQGVLGSTASRLLRKTRRPTLVVRHPPHDTYRRALVAIDFSPSSLVALNLVRRLAPEAVLVLVHAVEVPFEGKMRYAGVEPEIIQRYQSHAKEEALRKLHDLAERCEPSVTDPLAFHGDAANVILEQEQEQDCDLVVMGKHGRNVVEELLLGSTTKHVLSQSQGDLLIATGGAHENDARSG